MPEDSLFEIKIVSHIICIICGTILQKVNFVVASTEFSLKSQVPYSVNLMFNQGGCYLLLNNWRVSFQNDIHFCELLKYKETGKDIGGTVDHNFRNIFPKTLFYINNMIAFL